jgi:hypothetical protein
MFMNAKKLPATATQVRGKPAKIVDQIEGLACVAALDTVVKAIEALLEDKKAELREAASALLIQRGLARGTRPDSLTLAEDEEATGKAVLKRRSTTSPLSQDELEALAGLTGAIVTLDDEGELITAIEGYAETIEKSPEMLAINPAYAQDEAILMKLDLAVRGVKGLPDDLVIRVPAESRTVVADAALDSLFALDRDTAEQVFPIVAGVSITAVYKHEMRRAWSIARGLLLGAGVAA